MILFVSEISQFCEIAFKVVVNGFVQIEVFHIQPVCFGIRVHQINVFSPLPGN